MGPTICFLVMGVLEVVAWELSKNKETREALFQRYMIMNSACIVILLSRIGLALVGKW